MEQTVLASSGIAIALNNQLVGTTAIDLQPNLKAVVGMYNPSFWTLQFYTIVHRTTWWIYQIKATAKSTTKQTLFQRIMFTK